ncbi:MAG TPA: hypothetical protein VMP67_06175 [Candidatus Limnocylindria bacterium]|nr:hypothetical protein [Candidatus Limnocylindria bacterium]
MKATSAGFSTLRNAPEQPDWITGPTEKAAPLPPQASRTDLLGDVIRRGIVDEAEDKSLADPLLHWRVIR